jgi:hypothetical protein
MTIAQIRITDVNNLRLIRMHEILHEGVDRW